MALVLAIFMSDAFGIGSGICIGTGICTGTGIDTGTGARILEEKE